MTKQKPITPRFFAIDILTKVKKSGLPLTVLIARTTTVATLSRKDHHLAMNLIYGVLRQYQYLDNLLTILCRQPLKKLPPFVHQALAVGLFQIFFLDRIPESAAVNESVKAVKAAHLPKRFHGLVNGILRESIRQRNTLPQPGDLGQNGAPILNHPQWLTSRWLKKYSPSIMEEICKKNNTKPPLVVRVNSLVTTRENFLNLLEDRKETASLSSFAPDALILHEYQGAIPDLPGYNRGLFQVQGEAAQLASYLLQPLTPAGSYLDGCAGLGGKTGHLLELGAANDIKLTAVEPEQRRKSTFHENLKRLHPTKKVTLFNGSLQEFAQNHSQPFDGILIDAPCSGTGVIGRNPDIRWNRKESELRSYQTNQLSLLECGASLLKSGGVLVYATCSLEPEENEELINTFLKKNKGFSLTDCSKFLPQKARQLVKDKFFCPYPQASMDGFFAARLVLKG